MEYHDSLPFDELHKAKFDAGLLSARPATPEGLGDVYWATDANDGDGALYTTNIDGDEWVEVVGSGGTIALLGDIGDVDLTSLTNNQVLAWENGTSLWKNKFPDASWITFTAAVPADWDGGVDPGDTDDALNQLAERVKDLEVSPGDASTVTYTPADAADWDGGVDPGEVNDALDQLAERTKNIEVNFSLGDLVDVDDTGWSNGDILTYNGSIWEAQPAGGGASDESARTLAWMGW